MGDIIFWGVTTIVGLVVLAFILDYGFQQWIWNRGISRKTNTPWLFYGPSGNSRTYRDKDHNYITIEYSSIDEHEIH